MEIELPADVPPAEAEAIRLAMVEVGLGLAAGTTQSPHERSWRLTALVEAVDRVPEAPPRPVTPAGAADDDSPPPRPRH